MIALSREVAYIPCGAAMVACPQVFYWSSKRVAVRILSFLSLFVTGLFLLPQGKAVHWFFRRVADDFFFSKRQRFPFIRIRMSELLASRVHHDGLIAPRAIVADEVFP